MSEPTTDNDVKMALIVTLGLLGGLSVLRSCVTASSNYSEKLEGQLKTTCIELAKANPSALPGWCK